MGKTGCAAASEPRENCSNATSFCKVDDFLACSRPDFTRTYFFFLDNLTRAMCNVPKAVGVAANTSQPVPSMT